MGLQEKLDNEERGGCDVVTSAIGGERVVYVVWRGLSGKISSTNRNDLFMSTFIENFVFTTLGEKNCRK